MKKTGILFNLSSIVVVIFIAYSLSAQEIETNCGIRTEMIEKLNEVYKEFLTDRDLTNDNGLIEIFMDKNKNNWTIIVTIPPDQTCILATGKIWQDLNFIFDKKALN